MQEFLSKHITNHFPTMDAEVPLDSMDDSAVVDDVVFTIDGHTVKPLFFPGGDIGKEPRGTKAKTLSSTTSRPPWQSPTL